MNRAAKFMREKFGGGKVEYQEHSLPLDGSIEQIYSAMYYVQKFKGGDYILKYRYCGRRISHNINERDLVREERHGPAIAAMRLEEAIIRGRYHDWFIAAPDSDLDIPERVNLK